MTIRFSLFILFGFSLLTTSCTNEPKPTTASTLTVFSNFYVRYLQEDKELKAEAIFKIGDSIRTAQTKAIHSVFFEESAMELKDLGKNGVRYRSKKAGQIFKENYLFKAEINETQELDYILKLKPIHSFSIKEKTLNRSKGTTLVWEGTALSKEELLVVFFVNPDKKPVSLTINGPTNTSEVFLAAKNLSRLKAGKGQLRLIRKALNQLEDEPKNIESVIEYYTKSIDIDIVE